MGPFLKVHSHVTSAFTFFFGLCRPILQNLNIKRKHHHLLPLNPFLTFYANAKADVTCDKGFTETKTIDIHCNLLGISLGLGLWLV